MSLPTNALPAQSLVTPLANAISAGNVIVGAPPGAGKSTVLPLALLNTITEGKILLMQPRRVVVRNLAGYLAGQMGEPVGQTVGYRIRGESKVSSNTRLEVITEGILARRIQQDPELTDVSAILFDEFHERSIHSDFGLALSLEVQQALRDDLRLVIMSATLDVQALTGLLPDAQVLTTEGRQFPVETHYVGNVSAPALHEAVATTTAELVCSQDKDILVFLSGAGAIRRVQQTLEQRLASVPNVIIHTLFGAMEKDAQQRAIEPDSQGRQKVILATNIAETSLTIEGVGVVVDSGMENVASFHPQAGMTELVEQRISQASATQRQGRAGRLGPGHCYRMWAKETQERLASHPLPQILREDVTSIILEALVWGTPLPALAMLNQPSKAQLTVANTILQQLKAVDDSGQITSYGRELAAMGCHPRLAHMLLAASQYAEKLGMTALPEMASWVAAFAEGSIASANHWQVSQQLQRLDRAQQKRLLSQAQRYARLLSVSVNTDVLSHIDSRAVAVCLALAFPDRIGFQRGKGGYKLANGKGATLSGLSLPAWLVVLEGQLIGSDIQVRQAEPVDEVTLKVLYPDAFAAQETVRFNADKKQMEARRVTAFGAIDLTSEPVGSVPAKVFSNAWVGHLQALALSEWPLDEAAWQWWYRVKLAASVKLAQPQAFDEPKPWPESLDEVIAQADETLASVLGKCRKWQDVEKLPWAGILHQQLPWSQQAALDQAFPKSITVPSGHSHRLRYQENGQVILSVRMQEMYGQSRSLTLADGHVNVIVEFLSPAGRPLQMTSDLGAFWKGSYLAIQKEMKGRYPKLMRTTFVDKARGIINWLTDFESKRMRTKILVD